MSSHLPQKPGRAPAKRLLKAVKPHHPVSLPPSSSRPSRRSTPLWYAVCVPRLHPGHGERGIAQKRLQELAALLGQISATVSIQPPDSVVFEVRSSLTYFGGIANIRTRVLALLEPLLASWELESGLQQAVTPTAAASLLLARSGCNLLVYRRDSLRSALGSLPLDALVSSLPPAKAKQRSRQLRNSGLQVMRDLWRLPRQSLARRFGPEFVRQLDVCLGDMPMPITPHQAAPRFSTTMDFEYAGENSAFLLHAIDELLARLCLYLQQRELAAAHLQLLLRHEHREDTVVAVELRQASRSQSHLALLLETRIQALTLAAPVIGMQLEVQRFDSFRPQSRPVTGLADAAGQADQDAIVQLLEQLQARLGNEAVRSLHCHAEHGPELAGSERTFSGIAGIVGSPAAEAGPLPVATRPCWILGQPSALPPPAFRTLQLLSGPERIETRWWSGQPLHRDYYVARNQQGMRLWIYHERTGERAWYLHGVFD